MEIVLLSVGENQKEDETLVDNCTQKHAQGCSSSKTALVSSNIY